MNCYSQSGEHSFTFIAGTTEPQYINCITSDTTPVDFSLVTGVKMDIRTASGALVISYSLDDGIRVVNPESSVIVLFETPIDISVGTYKYDLFITFSADVIKRPLWGLITVVNNITQ